MGLQLIMRSTNPRDVAYIFRDYARKIHAKAVPTDPNFLRLSVACGKVRADAFRTLFMYYLISFVVVTDRTVVREPIPVLHPSRPIARWRPKADRRPGRR